MRSHDAVSNGYAGEAATNELFVYQTVDKQHDLLYSFFHDSGIRDC